MCNKEEFNNLCYLLTLPSPADHPDYRDWTLFKGRLDCFDLALSMCRPLLPASDTQEPTTAPNRLLTLFKQSLLYQVRPTHMPTVLRKKTPMLRILHVARPCSCR
jgi:hypothetical protein